MLLHNKEIVESSKEEIAFFGGFVPISALKLLVVADYGDDVDSLKVLGHDVEEFKSNGDETAPRVAAFAFGLFVGVADVEAEIAAIF